MSAESFYGQLDARLSESELQLLTDVRAFVGSVVAPLVSNAALRDAMPQEVIRKWAALGMGGLQTPRDLGGRGASFSAKVRLAQEVARVSFACAFSLNNLQGFVTRIAQYGSDQQKDRHLHRLLSGESVGAFAITEPHAGSDVAAIATSARKAPGGWILNGEKTWVTNSPIIDLALILAQTSEGTSGLAGFLVDLSSPGVSRLPLHATSVGRMVGSGGLRFSDCFVPDAALLHPPGQAFRVAMKGINAARIHVAAMCVAMLEAGLATAVAHCEQRQAFGKSLLAHQGLRWQLAQVSMDLEAANQLVLRGVDLVERGEDTTFIAACAKRFCVETAQRGLEACVQAMGAQGLLDQHGLARQLSEVKLAGFADGTTEMQTERISQLLVQRHSKQPHA